MPHSADNRPARALRREIQVFSLYRILTAVIMMILLLIPLGPHPLDELRHPYVAAIVTLYLLTTVQLAWRARHAEIPARRTTLNAAADILITALVLHSVSDASIAIAMSLVVNLTAAASMLSARTTRRLALSACAMLIVEQAFRAMENRPSISIVEISLLVICYLAMSWIGHQQGERSRSSQRLAEKRSAEVANLFEINELILRRMRTGVLVVDGQDRIRLANESAMALLGHPAEEKQSLEALSPALARHLQRWREGWPHDQNPLPLPGSHVDVQPRFASLMADSELALIFLDDTAVVSRRAESLTLSTLGRFSASLAHEIRNPLTAISYAGQLLEESGQLSAEDLRLVEIINLQCQRTNNIVESVLGLARRERANPENVELSLLVPQFVADYRPFMASERDQLECVHTTASLPAVVDPRHLQQVLTTLVHNALSHGRHGAMPVKIQLRLSRSGQRAVIDCIDDGPGFRADVLAQLFRPFFTTEEHGTGLGLYLARELCAANHGQLEAFNTMNAGACLRIILPQPGTVAN